MTTVPALQFALNLDQFQVSTVANADGLATQQSDGLHLESGLPFFTGFYATSFNSADGLSAMEHVGPAHPQTLTTANIGNLNLVAGEKLVIDYDYIPFDYRYNDFAFSLLKDPSGAIIPILMGDVTTYTSNNTYPSHFSVAYNIGSTGSFALMFASADAGDTIEPSDLIIHSVSIQVPSGDYSLGASGVRLDDGTVLRADGSALLPGGSVEPSLLSGGASNLVSALGADAAAGIISQDGNGLIGENSSGIVAQGGGNVISNDGGSVISNDGGSVISNDGGSVISNDGGSIISQDGNGIISQDGNGIISQDGNGLIGENSSGLIGENSSGLISENGGGIVGGDEFHVLDLDAQDLLPRQFSDATQTPITSGPAAGPEFAVGPAITSRVYEGQERIAALSSGKFAVAWTDTEPAGPVDSIDLQLVNADGTAGASTVKLVAATLDASGNYPTFANTVGLAALPNGGFAMAYAEDDQAGVPPYGTTPHLFVQIYDASGAAVGGKVDLGTPVSDVQSISATSLSDGSIVVLQYQDLLGVTVAQRVSASGALIGTSISVGLNDDGGAIIVEGTAVALHGGAFAVIYDDFSSGRTHGLYFQTINADGTQNTPVFITASGSLPTAAELTNGDIAVTWIGLDSSGGGNAAHVQVLTAAGVKVGVESVGESTEDSIPAAVTALGEGRFLVANSAVIGTVTAVHAQIYNADGTPSGGIIPGSFSSDTFSPAAAQLADGTVAVVGVQYGVEQNGVFVAANSLAAEPISLSGTASSSTSEATQQGRAVDGYISGATVFADANGDGKFTAGEATATTDSLGRYTFSTAASGTVILTGGMDTSTGLAFTETLTAPAGSLTVTPLTTLVQKIEAANGGNLVLAERQVNAEFGLAASTDVTALDPVRGSNAGSVNDADAFVSGAIVADTVALASAAGATGDLYAILGAQIAANPASFDPTSVASMQALGLAGAVASDASALAQASKTLLTQSQTADVADGQALLLAGASIEKVAQGATSAALAAGVAGQNLDAVVAAYTGANLASAVTVAGTPTLTGGGATITTDTVLGGDGVTRSVPFGTAALAALAAPLLAGVAPSTTLFIDNAGAYALSGVQTAAVDDATGPVVLAGDGAANETIAAGGGNLAFQDGAGAGTLVAGAGNDLVRLSNGGNWSVALGGGVDTVVASTGNDTLATGTGGTLMFLGAGASSVASAGADTIIGGAGSSTVNATGSALYFNTGAPTLFNALGASATLVGAGDETVNAGSANMLVFGGATGGLDFFAGGGSSTVVSYTGGGTLNGGGAPTLYFGIGPAAYNAGSAVDTVIGYGGGMTATGGANGTLFFTGAAGGNFLSTGSGSATIIGFGTGDVYAATGGGNSVIDAAGAADTIFGAQSTGANSFFAYAANDVVVGGSGSTAIQSAFGNHTLIAGSGSTLFQVLNSGSNRAITLENFQSGNDFVQLQDYQSGAASSALQTAAVIGGSEVLTLVDGTTVTFQGVAGITAASFV